MKFKYIIPITLSLLMSCSLDREPQDKLFSEGFWKNEQDVNLALMGCYAQHTGSVYDAYLDGYADNNYCQYPWESKATVASSGDINADHDFGYSFIPLRRFNYFLNNIDKASVSDNLKVQTKAEVRVLRAWYYFDMISKFGAVPLITNTINENEEGQVSPTSENEIKEFIVKELDESIADLPQYPSVKSRLGKAAAYAYKARVHLFYGEYPQVVSATQNITAMNYDLFTVNALTADDTADDYSSFVTFANATEKEKFYKGLRSYEKLFWEENKENKEVIFNSEFIEDSFNYIGLYLLPNNAGGGWSSVTPTQEMVNSYWKSDGTVFTPPTETARKLAYNDGNFSATNYLNEFKNRDTRLYASIMFPGSIWKPVLGTNTFVWQDNGAASNTSKTGYNWRKLVDPKNHVYRKVNDHPLIRFAEILLMYAEAQNEVSGPDATVYDALNKIRTRVGMPNVTSGLSQTDMREVIRNERRIELANEGFRWNDIRRWGIANQVMKSINNIQGNSVQKRVWESKHNRLPYPIQAVDRNPKLKDAQKAKGY